MIQDLGLWAYTCIHAHPRVPNSPMQATFTGFLTRSPTPFRVYVLGKYTCKHIALVFIHGLPNRTDTYTHQHSSGFQGTLYTIQMTSALRRIDSILNIDVGTIRRT